MTLAKRSMLIFLASAMSWACPATSREQTDLTVQVIGLQPPPGSVLKVNEPVTVTFRYKYTIPNQPMTVWAKVLDPTYKSTYEGSMTRMQPGTGVEHRFVYLTEPGTIETITIVTKDQNLNEVHAAQFKARYTYVANPELERHANDGLGSKVTAVSFTPKSPSVLRAGSRVNVDMAYDIQAGQGLDLSAEPITTCNMSYQGTTQRERGKGRILKHFTVGERCDVKQVKLTMSNLAGRIVFERIVDVDFKYVD